MTYTNSCCFRTLAGIAGRIVYGIFDITILDKINDFFHCHHCTVILRFLCGCAKMWQCDYVINSGNLCIWEICYILSNLSACKCLDHIIIIYKNISCKVQDLHAILHHGKCILIDHAFRRIKRRYMYSNVITLFINIFYILDVFYMAGKSPCCIDRHIWIITIYFHAKTETDVRYLGADCTKTDDAELLTHDLAAGIVFFLLLNCLCDILV